MADNPAGSVLIVAVDTRNRPPAFEDEDPETDGVQNDTATRKVDENTKAAAADDAADVDDVSTDNVDSVVMATDPDPNAEDADLHPGRGRCGQVPGEGQRPD